MSIFADIYSTVPSKGRLDWTYYASLIREMLQGKTGPRGVHKKMQEAWDRLADSLRFGLLTPWQQPAADPYGSEGFDWGYRFDKSRALAVQSGLLLDPQSILGVEHIFNLRRDHE